MTKLFSRQRQRDRVAARSSTAAGDPKRYIMTGVGKDNLVENLKRGCLAECLELKIGASVMFTKVVCKAKFAKRHLGHGARV